MKKALNLVSILAFGACFLSAAAYADCGSFDQLVSQSNSALAPLGDLSQPDCSSKPDESVIDGLISCFEGLSGIPARTQSDADMQLANLYGAITQCYRSGIGQQAPGKKSYENLRAATQADPSYEAAWIGFSNTIAGMAKEGFFQRQAIQIGLGISIDSEVQYAIQGLSALPQDAAVSAELAKLRSL